MVNIAGINIRSVLAQNLGGRLERGTLTKFTLGARGANNLTGGRTRTPTNYQFEGFFDERSSGRKGNTLIRESGSVVVLLGGTLPFNIEPEEGDTITMTGKTYEVKKAMGDPSRSVFEALVEG